MAVLQQLCDAALEERRSEVVDLHFNSFSDKFGNATAMAVRRIALETKEADFAAGFRDRDKLFELRSGVWRLQMLAVDSPEGPVVIAAGRLPTLRGCAEFLQVQIADTVFVER